VLDHSNNVRTPPLSRSRTSRQCIQIVRQESYTAFLGVFCVASRGPEPRRASTMMLANHGEDPERQRRPSAGMSGFGRRLHGQGSVEIVVIVARGKFSKLHARETRTKASL
jgi:hypothetical protein